MPYHTFKSKLIALNTAEALQQDFLNLARQLCIDLPTFNIQDRHELLHNLIILSNHAKNDSNIQLQLSELCHQIIKNIDYVVDTIPVFLTSIDLKQTLSSENELHLKQVCLDHGCSLFLFHGECFRLSLKNDDSEIDSVMVYFSVQKKTRAVVAR